MGMQLTCQLVVLQRAAVMTDESNEHGLGFKKNKIQFTAPTMITFSASCFYSSQFYGLSTSMTIKSMFEFCSESQPAAGA